MTKPAGSTNTSKQRSKRGCRTCKIRKVKCDEAHPACRRCVSTGRVCDGYGVWGGGGNFYGQQKQQSVASEQEDTLALRAVPLQLALLPHMTPVEAQYFDWFRCRTVTKIPGAFVLKYWNALLLQACVDEPAILHGILTLSSVHKRDVVRYRVDDGDPDNQEKFMLGHYIKTIHYLRPHFSTRDKTSVRIALGTCLVFVCIELLRGRFITAQKHFQNGLEILRELQVVPSEDEGIIVLDSGCDPTDSLLVDAFCRYHIKFELFRQTYQHPCLDLRISRPLSCPDTFRTLTEAWIELERTMLETINLMERARREQLKFNHSTDSKCLALHQQQQFILASLSHWARTLSISRIHIQHRDPDGIVCRLLDEYRTMVFIMASTCFRNDETIYDAYTSHFRDILNHSIEMWKIRFGQRKVRRIQGSLIDMSHSIADLGWIPPLYYIAIKCRIHRIRAHAVELINLGSHREGIWDSKMMAAAARKVIEIEESEIERTESMQDDFHLYSVPKLAETPSPEVPASSRLSEIEVVLSDGTRDSAGLRYRTRSADDNWRETTIGIS